ncbi:hypothetical protein BGZ70_007765 [Mortierella alpina]|uniref:Uncharacterized protein n=1 Tax=Mortierella alpina TaxID=64518 RepID=A0A9P6M6T2_MORAP|nr:hypothetical protein BGZ70_007765 [Mortierella alpina]
MNKLDIHSSEDLVPPFDHAPPKPPVDDVSQEADACVEEQPEAHPDSDFGGVSQDGDAFNKERSDAHPDSDYDNVRQDADAHPDFDLEDVSSCDTRSLDSDLWPESSLEVDEPFDKPSDDQPDSQPGEHAGEHWSENLNGHLDEHSDEHLAVSPEFTFAPRQSAIAQEAESAVPEQSVLEQASEESLLEHATVSPVPDQSVVEQASEGSLIDRPTELAVPEQSLHAHATESEDIQEIRGTSDLALARAGPLNFTASTNDLLSLVNGLLKYVEQPSIETGLAMLLTASNAKRRRDDLITLHRPIKKQKGQVPRSALQNLGDALTLHPFGKLLRIDQYEPMEPSLYLADVHSHGEDIAKTLAGALSDVHGFKSVKPTWDLKEVKFVCHNNRRKLLIGTSCWNAIVTASINLVSGDISVGIDNPSMPYLGQTKLWTRKDCALNPLLRRPPDNNGPQEGGFSQQAAMFYLFIDPTHLPLTVSQGFNNDCKKRASGARDIATRSVNVATNGGNRQVEKIFVDGGFTTTKAFDDGLVQDSIRKTIDLLLHDRKGKARAYHS